MATDGLTPVPVGKDYMNDFNKGAWLQKTSEYMTYIDQHKKNIIVAWAELKEALKDIQLLQRENIIDEMNWRIRRHDDSKMSEEEFLTLSTRLCKHSHKFYESQPCPQSKSSIPRITPQLG